MRSTIYFFFFLLYCNFIVGQTSLGSIQANTNTALPSSYNFQEYVFPEPDDQGDCTGAVNISANIEEIFFSQLHRHALADEFFFLVGHRPALFQVAITGTGSAPDVYVEGFMDGNSLGQLCMKGPENLSDEIDLSVPNMSDYFSVTLPKSWVREGLTLEVRAGNQSVSMQEEDLKIGPYTELNLVMYEIDILDYNTEEHLWPEIENFLQEVASAYPASVVRFGKFPERLKFQEIVANNDTEQLVRLKSKNEMSDNGIFSDGSINSIATLFMGNLHKSTSDFLSTFYFGNTLNLAPGGWGGGKSFVSFDYDDVFLHELGHAFTLPHWGDNFGNFEPNEYEYLYPYGGENGTGGGRGESWNFIQDIYEFINPICQFDERGVAGIETSDAMQRNNHCLEARSESQGPWDGFGDFSVYAMHHYLVGGGVQTGTVNYKGVDEPYQFRMQTGFPVLTNENGVRTYTRDAQQPPSSVLTDEVFKVPGEELMEQEVYLIYGTAHDIQTQANIVYKPIKFKGTLPPYIDPTDPVTFAELQSEELYKSLLGGTRDITLKVTYTDGTIRHFLNHHHSYQRSDTYDWGFHIWRNDLCNFSMVVPADKEMQKVELYKRPFVVRWSDDDLLGNINDPDQGITAENFMDDAVWQAEYVFGSPPVLGLNSIGNRVWNDLNRNGIDDFGEPGIEGVKLILWADSDGDGVPDSEGFSGVAETNENGEYLFASLEPGNYMVFVWSVDNWEEDGPLFGFQSSDGAADPNSDINFDDNGSPGGFPGLIDLDISSGIIVLTADGEPLGDGDREDDWFDFDPSGNMTIDFGFYNESGCAAVNGSINILEPICEEGDLGSIEIMASTGSAPHSFLWNTGDTTALLENVTAGSYEVSITDSNGCIGSSEIEFLASDFQVLLAGTDTICGMGEGSFTIDASGGVPPYSFEITGGNSEQLDPGIYTITAFDDANCKREVVFEIVQGDETFCMSSNVQDVDVFQAKVTPNPFTDEVFISVDNALGVRFEIYDLSGKKLTTHKLLARESRIELNDLLQGVYIGILRSQNGDRLQSFRLVKL